MNERKKQPATGVAISGWSGGRPDYEANRRVDITQRYGVGGLPGIYDEMVQQWSRVRANVAEAKDAARDIDVVTSVCGATDNASDGDESEVEREFNDALERLVLGDRLDVEVADGHDAGVGAFLAYAVEAPIYGWCLAEPYWRTGAGLYSSGERIVLRPLLRAGVDRLRIDYSDPDRITPQAVWYRTDWQAAKWLTYDLLLHLTDGGLPGQFFGHAPILRPLLALFDRYRSTLYNEDSYENAAKGLLTVEEPPGNNPKNASRIDTLIADVTNGRVTGFRHPNGTAVSWAFPSGSPPDYSSARNGLDMAVDHAFNSRMASLGISTHGSRAVAQEMNADDRRKAGKRQDAFLTRAYQRLGAWVARQMGYTGRIRRLRARQVSEIDSRAFVELFGAASRDGLITKTPLDEQMLRERIGALGMDDVGLSTETVTDTVSALQQQLTILQALAPADGNTPIAPAAAVQLLVNTGFARDAATDMVAEQLASARSEPRPAPGATGERAAALAEHTPACGCGACGAAIALTDGEAASVTIDVHGKALPRAAMAIEIDGVTVYPEAFYPFADANSRRSQLDASLATLVSDIATEHRQATWAALESVNVAEYSPSAPALEEVFSTYRQRYEAEILAHLQRVRESTIEAASAARQAQQDTALRGGADGRDVAADMVERRMSAAVAQGRRAAESIASRVQSAVEAAWVQSGGQTAAARRTFAPGQTAAGLAGEASGAANAIESVASLQAEIQERPDDDLQIIAMVRSAMNDAAMCGHCRERAGDIWRLPEDEADLRRQVLPDPLCEGGAERCRCSWLILYGRR